MCNGKAVIDAPIDGLQGQDQVDLDKAYGMLWFKSAACVHSHRKTLLATMQQHIRQQQQTLLKGHAETCNTECVTQPDHSMHAAPCQDDLAANTFSGSEP
jgi:hypothetical protein